MKLADSRRGLNIRQRIVLWIGGVTVLAGILYPQFQTNYYAWVNEDNAWVVFYQTNHRMFIADGEFSGMPEGVKKLGIVASYPESPKQLREMNREGFCVDRRDSIRIWNLLVQSLATAAVTLGLMWVLKRDSCGVSASPPRHAD